VRFHRPGPNQYYWGLIDKYLENINGEFSHPGYQNFFSFDATKEAPPQNSYSYGAYNSGASSASPPSSILNVQWNVLSNGYPGQLKFSSFTSGNIQYYTGPLQAAFNIDNVEQITTVRFTSHYNQWYVRFYRPNAQQWYYGMFDFRYRNLHGYFISGANTYPIYPFDATLSYDASFAVSDVVLGRFSDLGNSWSGGLQLDTLKSGSLVYDNQPQLNPTALSNPAETLVNLTISAKFNGIYLNFYRSGPKQWYYGLYERDLTNIHGSFTQGGGTYEWDATSTVYNYNPL